MIDYLTIRNFYEEPYRVRNWALQQEYITMDESTNIYGVSSNFPGNRTKKNVGIQIEEVRSRIEKSIEPIHGKVIKWDNPFNGLFQYCTCTDRSWIHTDKPGTWAGVLFLTPNPPNNSGTGFYEHKETGLRRRLPLLEDTNNPMNHGDAQLSGLNKICMSDGADFTKWNLIEEISNEFNKLILYRGDYWHSSQRYFGTTKYNSRLFQTFFFATEDTDKSLSNYFTVPEKGWLQ